MEVGEEEIVMESLIGFRGRSPGQKVPSQACRLTFEIEGFVPAGVQRPPLDLGLEAVLLVGQQRHAHVRVRRPRHVLGGEVFGLQTRRYLNISGTILDSNFPP